MPISLAVGLLRKRFKKREIENAADGVEEGMPTHGCRRLGTLLIRWHRVQQQFTR